MSNAMYRTDETVITIDVTAAFSAYHEAQNLWYAARNRRDDERATVRELEDRTEAAANEVMVNGGSEKHPITGSNAETRKAQIAVACLDYPAFAEGMNELRATRRRLDQAEAEMDHQSNRMKGARLAIEYATAIKQQEAAAFGKLEFHR